jgi:HEPN pEK499 p136
MNPPEGEEYYSVIASRTRKIITDVNHEYDATLLMNCLLGLLVVPKEKQLFNKEKLNKKINDVSFNWLQGKTIKIPCQCSGTFTPTLNEFLRRMRNAIAHFDIKSYPLNDKDIAGFEFYLGNETKKNLKIDDVKGRIRFSIVELTCFLDFLMSAAVEKGDSVNKSSNNSGSD